MDSVRQGCVDCFVATLAALIVGGVAGTLARYFLGGAVYGLTGTSFPYGTLVVNLSGCLLIGVFDRWALGRGLLSPTARLLLMTGFCGAYTTFSTLILETSALLDAGQLGRALVNFLGSGLLGLVLFRLGAYLGAAL